MLSENLNTLPKQTCLPGNKIYKGPGRILDATNSMVDWLPLCNRKISKAIDIYHCIKMLQLKLKQ